MQTNHFPANPSAQTAVLLASFNTPDRAHVDRVLRETNTPRSLYTLARVLRAAQLMDLINAPARDSAEHLEIFCGFNGNNHAQLAEHYHLTIAEVYRSIRASGRAARLAKAA